MKMEWGRKKRRKEGRKECICERSNGNGEIKSEHKLGYYVKVKLTDTVCGDGRKTKATHDHVFVVRQLETFPSVNLMYIGPCIIVIVEE